MRVPQQPGCTIDWRRVFSLPVTVPPEILPAGKVLEYLAVLDTTANILISTYDRFQVSGPRPQQARTAPAGAAAAAPKTILPRVTANTGVSSEFDIPNAAVDGGTNSVVTKATTLFSAKPPEAGNAVAVETQLQAKLPRDTHANNFTPLPIPFAGLDTIRFFFADRAAVGFAGALGLNDQGIIKADGTLATPLPNTLLATRDDDGNGQVQLGEVDRLILRAPIAGRFRFEPYYLYQSAAAFQPVGPSNSGRLIFEQPALSTREKHTDRTRMLVYKHRHFALDHVDRASVAPLIHRHLVLHLRFFKEMNDHFNGDAAGVPRLKIEESSSEVMAAVASDVNHLLRSWTAFLSVLRWRAQDIAADGQINATWRTLFPAKELDAKDAKPLIPIVNHILTTPALLESLLFFSEKVYSPLLAGQTWMEVLDGHRAANPAVPSFPVTKDQPPFTPKTADNDLKALQHDRLRQVENPICRWIGCYAGAPVGKPARVYASVAPVAGAFPVNGLTAYEVEALHVAGTAAATLGLPAAVAGEAGPTPGKAMNLNSYSPRARGFATYFSASTIAEDSLHTTIDFLLDLTQGLHTLEKEPEFLDLLTLQNATTRAGHPLLTVLRSDQHHKAKHIRRQMDVLNGKRIGADTLAVHSAKWWETRVNRPAGFSLKPTEPYEDDGTRPRRSSGVLAFADVFPAPIGGNDPSGFDAFDLTSAYLACDRMSQNAASRLPVPVLMALMEREGIRLFAAINRNIRNTTSAGSTLTWEALFRPGDGVAPLPRPLTDYPTTMPVDAHRGRKAWLGFPYGLDTFARPVIETQSDARVDDMAAGGVFTKEPGEKLIEYLRRRVWSEWITISPTHGIPKIWKLSRRAHWAGLSLMTGFFRYLELRMRTPTVANEFAEAGWTPDTARWFPNGSSPPPLIRADGTRVLPTDVEWKDYLTYYGLIYVAYNGGPNPWEGGPATWRVLARTAEAANPPGSPLGLRDFFMFKHARDSETLQNARHFIVGLDAFLRINFMENMTPADYAGATGIDTALPADRWGIP